MRELVLYFKLNHPIQIAGPFKVSSSSYFSQYQSLIAEFLVDRTIVASTNPYISVKLNWSIEGQHILHALFHLKLIFTNAWLSIRPKIGNESIDILDNIFNELNEFCTQQKDNFKRSLYFDYASDRDQTQPIVFDKINSLFDFQYSCYFIKYLTDDTSAAENSKSFKLYSEIMRNLRSFLLEMAPQTRQKASKSLQLAITFLENNGKDRLIIEFNRYYQITFNEGVINRFGPDIFKFVKRYGHSVLSACVQYFSNSSDTYGKFDQYQKKNLKDATRELVIDLLNRETKRAEYELSYTLLQIANAVPDDCGWLTIIITLIEANGIEKVYMSKLPCYLKHFENKDQKLGKLNREALIVTIGKAGFIDSFGNELRTYFDKYHSHYSTPSAQTNFVMAILEDIQMFKDNHRLYSELLISLAKEGLIQPTFERVKNCIIRFCDLIDKIDDRRLFLAKLYEWEDETTHSDFRDCTSDRLTEAFFEEKLPDTSYLPWRSLKFTLNNYNNTKVCLYSMALNQVADNKETFNKEFMAWLTSSNRSDRFINSLSVVLKASSCTEFQYDEYYDFKTYNQVIANLTDFFKNLSEGKYPIDVYARIYSAETIQGKVKYSPSNKWRILQTVIYDCCYLLKADMDKVLSDIQKMIMDETKIPLELQKKLEGNNPIYRELWIRISCYKLKIQINDIEKFSGKGTLAEEINKLKNSIRFDDRKYVVISQDLVLVKPIYRVFSLLLKEKHLRTSSLKPSLDLSSVQSYDFSIDDKSLEYELVGSSMYIPEGIDLLYQSYEIAREWLIQMQKQSDPSYATLAKYLHDQESIAPKETTQEWSNIWHTDNKLAAAITALLNDNKKKLSSIFMLGSFSKNPRLDKLKQCFSTIDTSCKTGYLPQLEDLLADLNQSKPLTTEKNTFALQCITVMNNHDETALDKIINWFPQINEVVEYLRENIKSTKELERAASEHTEIREGTYHVRGEMLVLLVRIWSIIDSNKADCVKLISDLIGASSHIQASKISQKSDNIKKYIAFFNSPESRDKQKNNLFRILNESTIFFTWVSETTFEMNIKITNSNKPINSNFATGDQRNQQDVNVEAAADTFTIVNDKEFIALYDRAVLFTEILSDNSRNDSIYKCFQDIGKMAIDSLAILNRFAKSGELINIFRAILSETEYTMNQLTYQQVREDERAICCTIGEDKSSDLTTLYECLYSLAERATAAKNQVFDFDKISKNLSILPWCTFTGVQLSFLLDYMKRSQMDDQSIVPTRRDKLMISNLLSHLDDSIDLDALSKQTKLENINTEITYEAILKLDGVFKGRAHILPEDKFDARLKVCFYVSGQDRTEKLITIFDSLFEEGEHSSRCLFCTRFSKEEEITSFLFRATCDPLEREYLVVDLHLLDTKLRDTIIRVLCDRSLKYKSKGDFLNTRITFLVPDKHETNLSIELTRRNTTSFREVSMPTSQTLQRNYYFEKHSHIVLVTSAKAGQGKTHWINRQVESHGEKLLVLNLSGKMSPAVLTQRLESIFSTLNKEEDESKYSLRIKIDIVDGLEESFDYLNQLLFKICYLRCVEFDVSYLSLQPISTFYIEVQNTFDDRLMNIPFVTYLRNLNARQNSPLLNHNIYKILDADTIDVKELKKLGLVDTLRFMNLMEAVSTIDKLKFIGILNIYDISDVEANHYFLQEETLIENMDNKQEQLSAREELCKKRQTWNKDRNCIESQEISKKFIKLEEISNKLIQALHQAELYKEKSKVLYKLATSYTSTADELKRFVKLREMLQNHIKNGKDAMLLLKFDRSSAFDSDFANALSEDHELLEDEALKQHIIYKLEDLFSEHTSTTQEEQDLMLSRLNFYHLKIVLSLLSTQAQELAECESLTYGLSNEFETLELKRQFIDMRNKLAEKILQQTREFAYSQVLNITQQQESHVSKRNQHFSQIAITSAENSIEGGQNMESSTVKNEEKKVELKNFVWLLVQGGSVKIIYRTVNSIDKNTLWLYESQYLKRENNSERKLKDLVTQQDFILELVEAFWTLSPEETLQRARQIESRISQNEKRFMFTLDNYMKIRLIMLRVNLRIPILLLGESGCGKTFILEFIAINFFCDTFELLVFHSGISERNFENFVDNCIEKANKDRNKRLWMFFDEINTTPLIPIISELVTERKAHFATKQNNELPDNIIVVCACNPFKFRSMDVDEEKSRRAEKAQLTHKVYPIPESLVSFSFNFGQLSPEDEITYIKSILRDEKIADLDPNFITTLSEALQLGQQFLRKNDSESAASIRDIRRFTRLIAVFQRFGKYSIAEALMLGFYVCYSIRKRSDETTFREYRERIEEFNDQIQRRISSILDKYNVRERSLERLFDTACQLYTKEVKRLKCWPDDISDNRPVRENLFIVINCLIAKVPLFICGRPGTSKTVSILIAKKLFEVSSQEKEQSALFKQLPQAEFFQIWGSKEMSAEQVQRHFDKTRAYSKSYAKRRKEDPKLPEKLFIVYFEEMGRADTNENNPLKVMHPLLEPREAENLETETECFIGVSNTTLDASKMSRMLYVPRCEMDRDELIATLIDYRIDERIRSKCPYLLRDVSIELCLVDAYVDYRAFEMKDDWHSSYYGPRDFYAMSKWINQNMEVLLEAIDNHPDLSKSVILQFFILSIERNFFRENDRSTFYGWSTQRK
jgi:hypothetical protein